MLLMLFARVIGQRHVYFRCRLRLLWPLLTVLSVSLCVPAAVRPGLQPYGAAEGKQRVLPLPAQIEAVWCRAVAP